MNRSLKIVDNVVNYINKFSQECGKEPSNLTEFMLWLNHKIFDDYDFHKDRTEKEINLELTHLLTYQNKYFKRYVKKVLLHSSISTADEYSFLLHLKFSDSLRKMELIGFHMLEAPTGIEIINRLLKKGLLEEFDDQDDKRSKRVRLTKTGKEEIEKLEPAMHEVYSKMSANMDLKEKAHIIYFLKKLDDFHQLAINN